MDECEIIYTIGIFRGHVFREYPNGRIEKANEEENRILKKFGF